MIFIHNEGITDPSINLALEEYALRNFDGATNYLLFYINEPSIIIGRNQNTLEEINHEYIEEHDIHVVRRRSGGGAVYHDLGNLNFSFMTRYEHGNLHNFKKFTDPVIRVLNDMGVEGELSGRNDIVVNGRKISGNAQFSTGKRMLSHGTLLLDSDLDEVTNALNVKMSKIQSKGHKSIRSRVANINEFLDEPLSIEEFRELLLKGLYRDRDEFETYHLTEQEWEDVHALRDERYSNWDWNYGKSPKFNIQRNRRFDIGEIDLRLDVEKGYIENLKIYGDFFGKEPVEELADQFVGLRYHPDDLEQALASVDVQDYFGDLPQDEFLNLLYGADE
ncbi:lipoate--protein ligase [Fodinibius salsisoli]|uniref:lipoate--protein ligase n=1 Tax=Fodinibius salsisoli TaxID=2820877 RepID=A0ABT3PNT7_9BACT|nr:lipoate--protein ligase [Fodinibius salsisoli]MCW9707521.1 lipoate--protein ligase [Fodinibius salsisoli]